MDKYDKIQTVYKRNPETKFKTLLEGQFSMPEFDYLKFNEWEWTEKINGTNIRIMWDGEKVTYGGKSDNAQLPAVLLPYLDSLFTADSMKIFEDGGVCLYGEGFGRKIQKGGLYLPDSPEFILFDVKIGGVWLRRRDVKDIASKLNCRVVPVIAVGTLPNAIRYCQTGLASTIGTAPMEGLVMRPRIELTDRMGRRIITKIKYKDFGLK